MPFDLNEYPYVIRTTFEDAIMYYNSGNFMLVSNPYNASRYKNKEPDSKHVKHAESQGGKADVITFEEAMKNFKDD